MPVTDEAILAHEPLIHEIAQQYVDEDKGVELDDLMQEGRVAAFLLMARELTPIQPWHMKLVMRNWVSHIRNHESAMDAEQLVWRIERGVVLLTD